MHQLCIGNFDSSVFSAVELLERAGGGAAASDAVWQCAVASGMHRVCISVEKFDESVLGDAEVMHG